MYEKQQSGHYQAGKVGDQVLGIFWHRTEFRTGPTQRLKTRWARGTGQVRRVVNDDSTLQ